MHVPVLVKEALAMLNIKPDGTYVDSTIGLGGHSEAILSALGRNGRLIGIDRDDEAIKYASKRLGNERVILKKGSFSDLTNILLSIDIREVDGVLFDLGVSMLQLKDLRRGFSFISDDRLDMRMDAAQGLTAWDVVNRYTEREVERILREYGEEPFAKRIAKAIAMHRKMSPINTCKELSEIVAKVYRGRGKTHPATRTFQAIRIEVNKELDELKTGLYNAVNLLKRNGRLCVITYHSLEDRIVKNFIKEQVKEGRLKAITKKPITPDIDEIRKNPSSRSAKLRGGERV